MFHLGPIFSDCRLDVVVQSLAQLVFGIGPDSIGETIDCRSRTGFLSDEVFRLVEFLPYDDDREGEKHSIEHANMPTIRRRFQPRWDQEGIRRCPTNRSYAI